MSYLENLQHFKQFIFESEQVRLRKEAGDPRPYSLDKILQTKSFCNVRREDDRGTRWLSEHWLEPHRGEPDVWFAAALYRRGCNLPRTAAAIGYPVPYSVEVGDKYEAAMEEFGYSRAYRLVVGGAGAGMTLAHAARTLILDGLWENREYYRPVACRDDLAAFTERLAKQPNEFLRMAPNYIGNFVAAQICADVKFTLFAPASR